MGTASDAFALGLSALCLRLCRPFAPLSSAGRGEGKNTAAVAAAAPAAASLSKVLPRLDPSYYSGAGLWRLPGVAEKSSPLCPALGAAARARAGGGGGGKQGGGGGGAAAAAAAAAAGGGDDDMEDDDDDDDEEENPKVAAAAALPFFPYFSPDPSSSSSASPPPHFIAECFFLTQRVLHVGLMPAINRFQEGWDHFSKLGQAQAAAAAGGGDEGRRTGPSLEESLFRDCGLAHLSEPSLVSDAVAFAALTATWLHSLLPTTTATAATTAMTSSSSELSSASASAALPPIASVPEYALRDACGLLSFILRCGGADVVGGADVGALVGALAALLGARAPSSSPSSSTSASSVATAPPLLSPLSAAACVELLQAMLSPQLEGGRRRLSSLGPAAMSPGERALVATVLATGGRGQGVSDLVPALMRAHAGCDVVVGLDVDRDRFDKFGFRSQVDALLMELWNDASCLSATAALAAKAAAASGGGGGGLDNEKAVSSNEFGDYVGSVLNSLIYLLEDCINRLQVSGFEILFWGGFEKRKRKKRERKK